MHKFRHLEEPGEKKVYMVDCEASTGEFSTKLWDDGKVQQNKCPCCGEIIR